MIGKSVSVIHLFSHIVELSELKLSGGTKRSESEFTFQSYDCSSRGSTLPSSARNCNSVRLIDLEETGDEVGGLPNGRGILALELIP